MHITNAIARLKKEFKRAENIQDFLFSSFQKDVVFHSSRNGVGMLYTGEGTQCVCLTPDFDVRGTCGYGGGSFDIHDQAIVFCERSGAIWNFDLRNPADTAMVFPEGFQTAAPTISPDNEKILFIYETGDQSGISLARLTQNNALHVITSGSDFYMQPVWHPTGRLIAWTEWDHPHMPWDASRVCIRSFSEKIPDAIPFQRIAGVPGSSANQPRFSPDGKFLSYIQRDGEWDSLVLFDILTHEKTKLIRGNQYHLRMPDWVQGLRSYCWSADSRQLFCITYARGKAGIISADIQTRELRPQPILPYTWCRQIDLDESRSTIFTIAAAPNHAPNIISVPIQPKTDHAQSQHGAQENGFTPSEIQFASASGSQAYAWFYPAETSAFSLAPCILKFHSGPTSVAQLGYSQEIQFFTEIGFSVAVLNYHGSVTYGYAFQDALRHRWGEIEAEDAQFLIEQLTKTGRIHPGRIAALGSSAGGFSVLCALIRQPGLFKAAVCSYAVSDLIYDATHTHKFERYYHRFLIGDIEEDRQRFLERSPIEHIDRIQDPVALFHGEKDRVVDPQQSVNIYKTLKARQIPCQLTVYSDEGHSFRKTANIIDFYRKAAVFLQTHIEE